MTRTEVVREWIFSENKGTVRVAYEKRNIRYSEKHETEVYTSERVHPRSKDAKRFDREIFLVNYGRNKNYGVQFSEFYELAKGALLKTLQARERMNHHMKVKNLPELKQQAYYLRLINERYVL